MLCRAVLVLAERVIVERYFSGEALYGDDLPPEEVAAWFEDEREAYASLGASDAGNYVYEYHALNLLHGFRHLPQGRIGTALGIGAAYGHEFRPILSRVDRLVLVEPSVAFRHEELDGVPLEYRPPSPTGDLPVEASSFDLVTCFGVLHHIANVSHVIAEIARVLRPGGHALVREPIVSMGDWRQPRRGLTPRERGIPLRLLRAMTAQAGFENAHEALCVMPLVSRIAGTWANSRSLVLLDSLLGRATAWNHRYHATAPWHKVQPTNVFLVLKRR